MVNRSAFGAGGRHHGRPILGGGALGPGREVLVTAAPTAAYPLEWEADVLLVDGGVAHLRPSGPADADAIRAMHGRLSQETLYAATNLAASMTCARASSAARMLIGTWRRALARG